MLLRKDIEIIFSNSELLRIFHDLEKMYHHRNDSEEENKKYKYYCKLLRERVEDEKGEIIPF